MRKYNLIILAGGEAEFWCHQYGYNKKAFLPILGKPMLGWVVEAFHRSKYIDNIVVVGPKELNQLGSMHYVHKHLIERRSFMQNLLYAVFYIKTSIYKFANTHNGYLISFCDAVFLTTDIIDATLKTITGYEPGIALHYIQRKTITEAGFPAEHRSYMHVGGKDYTGSSIYYVGKFRRLLGVLNDITLLREYRKNPKEILKYLGCDNKDVSGIEGVLSKRLSTKVKIFISPYAEMGVDVDNPADYELARLKFQKRQREYARA